MRRWLLVAAVALALCGCESKRAAQQRAREAYVAGQEQALARQQAAMKGQTVTLQGEVETPTVRWMDGMTLTQAIVAAKYTGFMNPSRVRVIRGGQVAAEFFGVDLLRGKDALLQPGDLVVLTP